MKNVEIWYNLFNIYRFKKSIYWRLRKKIKIDLKKLEGEGDQYIFILIIYLINTHVSTLYFECRVTVY